MSTSQLDPVLSVENPVSLIRSRIKEKRLFEARFLCRQLGDALGAKERLALERELTGLMDQVVTLQHQARVLLDEGQKDQVVRLYNEIEAIAIDVPGLAEEKRALEGSEAIIAKLSSQTPHAGHRQHRLAAALAARHDNDMGEQEAPIMPHIPPSDKEEQGVAVPAAGTHRKKRVGRRLWLAAGLVGLLLLLFFVWRGGKEIPSPALSPTTDDPENSDQATRGHLPGDGRTTSRDQTTGAGRSEAGRSAHPTHRKKRPPSSRP